MSYLSIPLFNVYEPLDDSDSYLLIIKNKQLLYYFLQNYNYNTNEEYIKVFDESNNQIKAADYIDIVTSILSIDVNTKKNINALVRQLKTNTDILKKTSLNVTNIVKEAFDVIKMDSPIDIISDANISEDDIVKMMDINIDECSNTMIERLNNYVKVSYELRNVRVFIFYNLLSFLTETEIELLIHNSKYSNIKIIDIEYFDDGVCIFDHKKIVDKDICLLE